MSELNTLQFNYQVHINAHTTSSSSSAVLGDLQTICVVSVDLDLDLTSVSRTLELFIMFIIKLKFEITLFWLKFPQIHIC